MKSNRWKSFEVFPLELLINYAWDSGRQYNSMHLRKQVKEC